MLKSFYYIPTFRHSNKVTSLGNPVSDVGLLQGWCTRVKMTGLDGATKCWVRYHSLPPGASSRARQPLLPAALNTQLGFVLNVAFPE